MLRFIFRFSTLLSIISCADHQEVPKAPQSANNAAVDTVAIVNDPTTNVNIQASSFTEIDSSGILMFPLAPGERESNAQHFVLQIFCHRCTNVLDKSMLSLLVH